MSLICCLTGRTPFTHLIARMACGLGMTIAESALQDGKLYHCLNMWN